MIRWEYDKRGLIINKRSLVECTDMIRYKLYIEGLIGGSCEDVEIGDVWSFIKDEDGSGLSGGVKKISDRSENLGGFGYNGVFWLFGGNGRLKI